MAIRAGWCGLLSAMLVAGVTAVAAAQAVDPPADGGFAPEWEQRPTGRDFAVSYPRDAVRRGQSGVTVLCCTPNEDRYLACRTAFEAPRNAGFGEAAVRIARRFRMTEASYVAYRSNANNWLQVPINFAMAPLNEGAWARIQRTAREATQGLCRPRAQNVGEPADLTPD